MANIAFQFAPVEFTTLFPLPISMLTDATLEELDSLDLGFIGFEKVSRLLTLYFDFVKGHIR